MFYWFNLNSKIQPSCRGRRLKLVFKTFDWSNSWNPEVWLVNSDSFLIPVRAKPYNLVQVSGQTGDKVPLWCKFSLSGSRTQVGKLININNSTMIVIFARFISDKCCGLLLRARRYKLLSFEGEMLFQVKKQIKRGKVNLKVRSSYFQGKDDNTVVTMSRKFTEIHGFYKVSIKYKWMYMVPLKYSFCSLAEYFLNGYPPLKIYQIIQSD